MTAGPGGINPASRGSSPAGANPNKRRKNNKGKRAQGKKARAEAQTPRKKNRKARRAARAAKAAAAPVQKAATSPAEPARPAAPRKRGKGRGKAETSMQALQHLDPPATPVAKRDPLTLKLFKGVGGWRGVAVSGVVVVAGSLVVYRFRDRISPFVSGGLLFVGSLSVLALTTQKSLRGVAKAGAMVGAMTLMLEGLKRQEERGQASSTSSAKNA